MEIVELNETYLNDAIRLVEKIFNPSKNDKLSLTASIYPEKYQNYLQKNGFIELKYYVLVDEENVIGITGLYAYDDESYWLGWFCIDEKYRNKGLGHVLLNLSISYASNRKCLYLYTEELDEFKIARKLYEKYGFELYKREGKFIYYKFDFAKHKDKFVSVFSDTDVFKKD